MAVAHYLAPLALLPTLAIAGPHYARAPVIGVQPVYETVRYAAPREQCYQEQVPYRAGGRPRSATPTIIGAILGGALGNELGHHKRNKQVGAVVGAILGGSIARDISRRRSTRYDVVRYRTEQVCQVVQDWHEEERLAGFDVTYRYGGETYTTRMDRDPGDSIRVRVHVTPLS